MARPVVLLLHRDPVVHELVVGTLGDEFQFVAGQTPAVAAALAAERHPAVLVIDVEVHEAAAELARSLSARDPHMLAARSRDARVRNVTRIRRGTRRRPRASQGMLAAALPPRDEVSQRRHRPPSRNGATSPWVEFDLPGGGCLAITNVTGDEPRSDGATIAFEVDDLPATIADLKSKGVTFKAEDIESPVCRMAVCLDSEGNAIILHKLKSAEERAQ